MTATFPPYHGGTGNVAYHNALELARHGHAVDIFTAATPLPPAWREPEAIAVHRLRTLMRVGNAPLTPSLIWRLRGYDLIHLHWPYLFGAELVWRAARLHGVPYVVTYHHDLVGSGRRAAMFAAYEAVWLPRIIRGARIVFAISHEHFATTRAAAVTGREGVPVRELVNGVDVENFRPGDSAVARRQLGLPVAPDLLLFVTALDRAHHYKGLSTAIDAVARLPGNVRLIVVGDGDCRAAYVAEAAGKGVADRVQFVGAVGHDRLPDFYRAADVTVLPSASESFGLVLAESMACGTPMVATDLPGTRRVVDHGRNGFLIPAALPSALVNAVNRLLEDRLLLAAFGRRAREKVLDVFDWASIGRRLVDEYGTVGERRGHLVVT
ncbi:MAG: glycosyltransferase family 4 protein [Chloroflexota bacterium]|nr:glycosyltransferase family 4 protein [Chloroflexota bacterium]